MWIKHLFLGFIGLASGVGVAAGTFAFIIVIGVVPRMIAKCNRAQGICQQYLDVLTVHTHG